MSIQALVLATLLAQVPSAQPAPPAPPAFAPDAAQEAPEVSAPIVRRDAASSRPWLGVSLAGEDNLDDVEVHAGSPAAAAGLQGGDRLLALDRDELESYDALAGALSSRHPGESVRLAIARTVSVALSDEHRAEDGRPLLGVYLDGNRITEIQEDHPAAGAGLAEGDRIVEIDGEPTQDYDAIVEHLRAAEGDSLDVRIERRLSLELGARPDEIAIPRSPEVQVLPRNRGEGFFQVPDQSGLRGELRALSEEIASLRAEIAGLRAQIEALHPDGAR